MLFSCGGSLQNWTEACISCSPHSPTPPALVPRCAEGVALHSSQPYYICRQTSLNTAGGNWGTRHGGAGGVGGARQGEESEQTPAASENRESCKHCSASSQPTHLFLASSELRSRKRRGGCPLQGSRKGLCRRASLFSLYLSVHADGLQSNFKTAMANVQESPQVSKEPPDLHI